MFHRVLWFKRARRTWGKEKSVHGVKRITRLMQEIRHTRRKAPSTKQPKPKQTSAKQVRRLLVQRLKRLHKEKLHLKRYAKQLRKEKDHAVSKTSKKRWNTRWKQFESNMFQNRRELHLVQSALPPVRVQSTRMHKVPQNDDRCVYCHKHCHRTHRRSTREHLLPRSVGGTLVVCACGVCNTARGNRGDYKPFRQYIQAHEDQWLEAIASTSDMPRTLTWLRSWNLTPWGDATDVVQVA